MSKSLKLALPIEIRIKQDHDKDPALLPDPFDSLDFIVKICEEISVELGDRVSDAVLLI
jgi:hypothetical protein